MKIFVGLILSFLLISFNQIDEVKIRIFMVGDSTMANKSYAPGNPEKGPALRVGTHRRDVGSMDGSCKQQKCRREEFAKQNEFPGTEVPTTRR